MKAKIQRSMLLVLFVTILIFYGLLTLVMYQKNLMLLKEEVNQEARYIRTAVDISGPAYLKEMDGVDIKTRVTRISTEGKVLYDSGNDAETLENHSKRPEVKEALASGTGEDVRVSGTVGKEMYYYAILLQDGSVLRVAKTMDNLAVVMMIFAWILGRWQTERLIRPINELDIEHPLENVVYEELRPLLTAMDRRNKEKAAVEDMRKEFSANVSHELKTPLTSISGYAEIMENGLVRPEDIPEFAGRIHHEATRLKTLVEDIIELSKLDENSGKLPFETVDIGEMSREVLKNLEHQAEKKKINLIFTGEDTRNIRGVYRLLYEIFYNLADNAVKYTGECGRVHVDLRETPEGIVWSVEDNGIGIAKEDQERIFERFYRVDKSHSRETGGTGLGLSIVKHAALVHQAKIRVESEVGKGTKITVVFQKEN